MNSTVSNIHADSGCAEYFTPSFIIEAARSVMGSIDLDPASCAKANETVNAARFFTKEDDGLSREWTGNVWMNHPFSRSGNMDWISMFVLSYTLGSMKQGCCITYASTSETWFRPLMQYPQCYLRPRTNYVSPDGKIKRGVSKGSAVTYLGPNSDKFFREFRELGSVVMPYRP
jgi:DNA N-6-adenine-methyltransferase (Dam)